MSRKTSSIDILVCSLAAFVTLVILLPSPGEGRQLRDEVKAIVRDRADEQPVYMDALLPDMVTIEGNVISLSSVPRKVVEDALFWIKKTVKENWLPESIENELVAIKDMKQWEKRDRRGVVFSERVGDFLLGQYEIQGHVFHIQENGVSLSLRIDLPQSSDISKNPKAFIEQSIREFVNVPAEYVANLTYNVRFMAPIYYGNVSHKRIAVGPSDEGTQNRREWWEDLTVCTDGSFFFISFLERDVSDFNPQARPGLPDRF